MNRAVVIAVTIGLAVGGLVGAGTAAAVVHSRDVPEKVTVQLDRHPKFQPLVCSFDEQSPLVDCQDGSQLEYDNHGWWYKDTPDQLRATWNLPPKLETPN